MPPGIARRLRWALHGPASNLYLCGAIALAAAVLLLAEAVVFPAKPTFALLAAPTVILALLLIHVVARAGSLPLDEAIGRFASGVGLAIRPGGTPSILAVLLYCAGIVGAAGGYAWLALTTTGITRDDTVVVWGLLDKRQPVFAYLVVVAFVLFHRAIVGLFFAPTYGRHAAPSAQCRSWLLRAVGAVVVAVAAYCWLGAEALRDVVPAGEATLAKFYEYHSLVHLGALEQIRLGATPYVEAQTQYGLGNQLLAYGLTKAFGFRNHGFYAGVLLVDVVCIVGFFVIVQQMLGLGWALAGLVGWVLWPSPAAVIDLAGWAILTRWIAVPILALLLARLLLSGGPLDSEPRAGSWMAPVAVGVIGRRRLHEPGKSFRRPAGADLLAWPLRAGVRPAAAKPGAVRRPVPRQRCRGFAALIAGMIGVGHTVDVLRQASAQSALVMAGVSNSVWSDNVGLTLTFESCTAGGGFADDARRGAPRAADLWVRRPAHDRDQPAGGLSRPVMAGGERGPAAVRLEVRRRNARRLCAASLRAVALRSLPSRRTVLSPAAVSAGAAGLRLALPAAGPRAWTAAAGVGRADRRSRDRRPIGAHPPR